MGNTNDTTALGRRLHLHFERAALMVIDAKRSPNTKKAYRRDLKRWIAFCIQIDIDPLAPPLSSATEFRDHLINVLADSSVIRVLAAMSAVYRSLMRGKAVMANPFHPAVLSWPQASSLSKTKAVNDKVAMAMLKNAREDKTPRGARDYAILRLLYDTGLRRESVARILRSKYRDGCIETVVKGDKEAELELPKESAAALDRWLKVAPSSPYLFPGRRGHIDLSVINKLVRKRGDAVSAGPVHPHMFRSAFVTAAYDAELPEYEIQGSVHHSDPRTTRRYDKKARGRQVATRLASFRGKTDE